jgi:zinc transport system substrate-binding protein
MRKAAVAALALALAAGAAGCGTRPAHDGPVRVVAGFDPLQFVAQQVGGDRVRVTNLAQPGAEPDATGDYLSVMRDNLTALVPALGCA